MFVRMCLYMYVCVHARGICACVRVCVCVCVCACARICLCVCVCVRARASVCRCEILLALEGELVSLSYVPFSVTFGQLQQRRLSDCVPGLCTFFTNYTRQLSPRTTSKEHHLQRKDPLPVLRFLDFWDLLGKN